MTDMLKCLNCGAIRFHRVAAAYSYIAYACKIELCCERPAYRWIIEEEGERK